MIILSRNGAHSGKTDNGNFVDIIKMKRYLTEVFPR